MKKNLKFIWNKFIRGGHLTSLGAISIALLTVGLIKIKVTWTGLIVVYLGCEIIYLYNRYMESNKDILVYPEQIKIKHLQKYDKPPLLLIFVLILVFITILIIMHKISLLIFGFLLVFFGLLYSVFIKNLTRDIIAFKTFFVSLWWAAIVIFVSLFYSYHWTLKLFLVFFFVWINIFIQEVLLDIRDIKEDQRENLLTLPLILNRKLLFYILFLLTILAIIPIIYGVYFHLLPIYALVLIFTIPYNFFLIKNINKICRNFEYLEILIEGQKIMWGVLIFPFYFL